jgi:hypothetical protein
VGSGGNGLELFGGVGKVRLFTWGDEDEGLCWLFTSGWECSASFTPFLFRFCPVLLTAFVWAGLAVGGVGNVRTCP